MIKKHRFYALMIMFFAACMTAQNVFAIDILEVRIKRLYQETEMLVAKGDYDSAIEVCNKAIGYAKDKDIKQFLVNAHKEIQRKRRANRGAVSIFPSKEGLEQRIFDSGLSKEMPNPKSIEGEAVAVSPKESEEKAAFEMEKAKLESDKRKLEEEKVKLEREKRKKEIEEEKAKLEREKAEFEAEKKKLEDEKAKLEAEISAAVKENEKTAGFEEKHPAVKESDIVKDEERSGDELADLEENKEREACDRTVYESTDYRYRVKEVLTGALEKIKEAALKMEDAEILDGIESKINKLVALDQQAEEFVAQGQYKEARGVYKKIMEMSKDTDLKEYLKPKICIRKPILSD